MATNEETFQPSPDERTVRNNVLNISTIATATRNSGATQNLRMTATIRTQNIPANNNNNEAPQQTQNLFHMRDRLFLALFFRVTLIYARACPKTFRRVLEFCLLVQSILLLCILGYIHVVYTRSPITCLADYKNSWPRDGVLRVEITTEPPDGYNVAKSYEKEERLRQRAATTHIGHYSDDFLTMMFAADTLLLDRVVATAGELFKSVTSMSENSNTATSFKSDHEVNSLDSTSTPQFVDDSPLDDSDSASSLASGDQEIISPVSDSNGSIDEVQKLTGGASKLPTAAIHENSGTIFLVTEHVREIPVPDKLSEEGSSAGYDNGTKEENSSHNPESLYFNKSLEEIETIKMMEKKLAQETVLKSSVSEFEMFANSVWIHDHPYIVEYALEYGFLRLSPETRLKLNISVTIVTLNPSKDECFGDSFSRFLLDNFIGYDDILMSSIKNLAESEENKGFLRNVVTGEQFRFVPMWMARTSYIPAFLIMLVFTVSISMLLRYSHHQIFVFIVDLLNNIEGAGAVHIPAAPLFTVILALVGMEAIMSEFFNDTSTAFYVILIVWIADQYDSVCSHTNITKAYWVRFFYLYHFAFYAYHYRFNGQYGSLALLVSWSFIQHSMVYFYHHYELPAILRQAASSEPPLDLDDESPIAATSGQISSQTGLGLSPQNVDASATPITNRNNFIEPLIPTSSVLRGPHDEINPSANSSDGFVITEENNIHSMFTAVVSSRDNLRLNHSTLDNNVNYSRAMGAGHLEGTSGVTFVPDSSTSSCATTALSVPTGNGIVEEMVNSSDSNFVPRLPNVDGSFSIIQDCIVSAASEVGNAGWNRQPESDIRSEQLDEGLNDSLPTASQTNIENNLIPVKSSGETDSLRNASRDVNTPLFSVSSSSPD